MPPSGFNQNHTKGLVTSLHHCLMDLVEENRGVRTPQEAIAREIRHIDGHLEKGECSPAATAAMQLVRAFYDKIAKRLPSDDTRLDVLFIHGYVAELEVAEEIELIHVTEEAEV